MNTSVWRMCLSVVMVLGLLLCAANPVRAEAPPPPSDDSGGPVTAAPAEGPGSADPAAQSGGEAEKTVEAAEIPPAAVPPPALEQEYLPPLLLDTDSARPAVSAVFPADGQMLDANGVLRAQGETLAALFLAGAIACPLGKVPLIYGGSSNTGCTMYYDSASYVNPIEWAHGNPLTKSGWWIWVSPSYNKPWGTYLSKSVTVAGDPLGTSVTGNLELAAPNITLRELVINEGTITSTGQSGTLRLQNVRVGSSSIYDQYGIDIAGHRGSVVLTNVSVSMANGGGARLDTTGGSGTVTVLNGAFNFNQRGSGLQIDANNAVRVENVAAVLNGKVVHGGGLWIRYRMRLTLKNIYTYDNFDWGVNAQDTHPTYGGPVTLQNITANENDIWAGMWLIDPGPLSGSNLTANGNDFDNGITVQDGRSSITLSGVMAVENLYAGVVLTNGTGSVSVSNSQVSGNWKNGLVIFSRGTVSVRNSVFTYNKNAAGGGNGVSIDNTSATTPRSVTLTDLHASGNEGFGFYVLSRGTASLSGISAVNNHYGGGRIVTNGGATVGSSYGVNVFSGNGIGSYCTTWLDSNCDGLYIDAEGAVSISSATANDNRHDGISVLNASSARVSGSTASGNPYDGVYIDIRGPITIDRTAALYNNGAGFYLWNDEAVGSNPSITLSHVTADYNYWGMGVYSRGPLTLNHASASQNHGNGLYLNNSMGGTGTGNVTLTNSLGSDLISSNDYNLIIISRGSVALSGVNSSGCKYGLGAVIDNADGTGSVSISSSIFNDNGDSAFSDSGLSVQSRGSISLTSVTASENKGAGAVLSNNTTTLTGKTVSVKKSVFNNNGSHGADIASKSTVTLDNVVANWNYGYGAKIDNYSWGGTGSVNVLNTYGRNQFSVNTGAGLNIMTAGNVTIRQTDASNASGAWSGVEIYSYGVNKTALFNCVSALSNTGYGIYLMQLAGSMKLTLQGVGLVGNSMGGLSYSGLPVVSRTTCQ